MTRLTILPADGAVYQGAVSYIGLDLSSCGIPDEMHALQWDGSAGYIEFNDTRENEEITALPEWANACVAKWNEAKAVIDAAEAARIAAEEAAAAEAEQAP
jgi:hypothetical protein